MIVSYLHNYIFIKTKKTAGTTVEWVLSQSCGPDDVTTLPRKQEPQGPRSKRSAFDPTEFASLNSSEVFRRLAEVRDKHAKRRFKASLRAQGDFHNHITAEQLRAKLEPEFWGSAFKFTSERHPYEKAVSFAYFQFNQGDRHLDSFERLLDEVVSEGDYAGFHRWSIDGTPVMDDFVRQESLRDDLKRIGAKLGIPIPDELPQLKGKARKDRRPAREILSEKHRQIIYERCRREFELLGYDP